MLLQAPDSAAGLRDWLALGISVAALAQVWAIAGWKRFVRRGTLRAHETGNLEVGFSTFGPTLALLGTLRAINQDVFVEGMTVRVVRLRDRAQRVLGWRAFRSSGINPPGSPAQLDLPRSFLVQPASPHNYNIVFADDEFDAEFRGRLNEVADRWRTFVQAEAAKSDIGPPELEKIFENPNASQIFWSEFFKEHFIADLYAAVSERFFWHAGEYEVFLETVVAAPARAPISGWRFEVTEKDSKSLRTNAVGIFRAQSGYNAFFHFAYPTYLSLQAATKKLIGVRRP